MREESIPTENRERRLEKEKKILEGKHFQQLGVINKNKCKDDFKSIP